MSHSHIIEDSLWKPGELHLVWLCGSLPLVGAAGLVFSLATHVRPSIRLLSWHIRRIEYCIEREWSHTHIPVTLTSTSVTVPTYCSGENLHVANFEVASSVRWGYVSKQLNRSVYVKRAEGVLCSGNWIFKEQADSILSRPPFCSSVYLEVFKFQLLNRLIDFYRTVKIMTL